MKIDELKMLIKSKYDSQYFNTTNLYGSINGTKNFYTSYSTK